MTSGQVQPPDPKANQGETCFHAFVATLLLQFGAVLFGLGIWLHTTEHGGPSALPYARIGSANATHLASVAVIIFGCFLLSAATAYIVALSCKAVSLGKASPTMGSVFRIVYLLTALCILAALVFLAAVSFFVVNRRDSDAVRATMSAAWKGSVAGGGRAVCKVEAALGCRGFKDSRCAAEKCAVCPNGSAKGARQARRPTCYDAIRADIQRIYLPTGIVSVVAAFVLADILLTCGL